MNEALEQNQKEWKIKIEETEKRLTEQSSKKIADLQDQIKDLMFYIEAKEKVADNGELQDGQLVVVPGNNTASVKKTKKKKSKT
jgi:BRCA1-associated protein